MVSLTNHGAELLGERIGHLTNGFFGAILTLFLDLITASWLKTSYLLYTYMKAIIKSDSSLRSSKSPWYVRLLMASIWAAQYAVFLVWVPRHLLLMISRGFSGYVVTAFIMNLAAFNNDGPANEVNKATTAYNDAAIVYIVTAYLLTHLWVIKMIMKWVFLGFILPSLPIGAVLYYVPQPSPISRALVSAMVWTLLLIPKALDKFDYIEASIVERFPQYLQHKWSSYQQSLPRRTKLSTYRHRPLGQGEIRLLILKRASWFPSVIEAEVVHRQMYPPPDYEALSYRWGSEEMTDEIIVDGCRLPVTQSAFRLLLARRSMLRDRTVWIDQICINQNDIAEKTVQVQQMRDIYHRATRVIAFPSSDWRCRIAAGQIYQIWARSYQEEDDPMEYLKPHPDSNDTHGWKAVADLFSNEYFTRAWIVQEIAVAGNVEVYAGGTYIPWQVFSEAMMWSFHPRRRRMLIGSNSAEERIWHKGDTYENIAILSIVRPGTQGWMGGSIDTSTAIQLENLVYMANNTTSKDPRDKIFAFVGLAKSKGDPALTLPDYSLSTERVFRNAAQAIFTPTEGTQSAIHVLSIAGIGFNADRRTLPSWVPDFGEKRACYPWSDPMKTPGHYAASGDTSEDLQIDTELDALLVSAIEVDEVLYLSEVSSLDHGFADRAAVNMFAPYRVAEKFAQSAMDLCEKYSPSEAPTMIAERLWLAFIAGRINRKPADAKFKEVFPQWLKKQKAVALANSLQELNDMIEKGSFDADMPALNDGTESDYQMAFMEACYGRRVGMTRSGRFCLVPPLTEESDSIFIPLGAQTPLILRRKDDAAPGIRYELVGETWVEGMMNGEMFIEGTSPHMVCIM
ncbi:HET-domain-containing protein [Xylariaceae sp. FL1272]|nr:HET-domain-containing protein [Xylariaceae sp. FL1272]